MKKHGVLAAMAVSLFAGPVHAETVELTLERAIELAVEKSPEASIAREEVELSAAEVVRDRMFLPSNPVVEGWAGRRNGGDFGDDWVVGGSQRLSVPGQRGARLSASRNRNDAARARYREALHDLGADVGTAFIDALEATERLALAEESSKLGEELLSAAKSRYDAGASNALDLNLARIERGRAAGARLAAERDRVAAMSSLRARIGLAPDQVIALSGRLADPPQSVNSGMTVASAVETALRNRGEVEAAQREGVAARRDLLAARLALLPQPTVHGQLSKDDGDDLARVGISLAVPLFDRNQGERRRANASLRQARAREAATRAEIAREVETALSRVQSAKSAVEVFGADVQGALEENASLLTESYRAGKIDFIQLVVLRQQVVETRLLQLAARAEWRRAHIELDRATGAHGHSKDLHP